MSVSSAPGKVERARRELRRLVAFREWELKRSRQRTSSRFSWLSILAFWDIEFLLLLPCCFRRGKRVETRFERLQSLDKLIAEREAVIAAAEIENAPQ